MSNQVNPQTNPSKYNYCCKHSGHDSRLGLRKFNNLFMDIDGYHISILELDKLREGLDSNVVNPKPQPNHYDLIEAYGYVSEKALDLEFINNFNIINANAHRQSFLNQEFDYLDLATNYIW